MAISLTSNAPYSQDFNTLANTGTSSILPAEWVISESGTAANTTYTAGTGSANTGDTYSFGAAGSTDRALGGLQSGSLVPTFGTSFTNNTGSNITGLNIAYTGERWRVGAVSRNDQLDFQYSTDATSLTTGTWTDVNALDYAAVGTTTGAFDGNAAANRAAISSLISSLSFANGSTFWIRWNDLNATGADDGLAVDDFSLTPVLGTTATLPTLTITALDPNAAEAGQDPGTIRISSSTIATSPINVSFNTGLNGVGQATFGVDYASIALAAQIATGSSFVDITITPIDDALAEGNEAFTVNLLASPSFYTLGSTTSATVTIADNDVPVTKIHAIQGAGAAAALTGTQTIEGIVTRVFAGAGKLNGFYVQEEDADADTNTATSEAIFVFDTTGKFTGNVGDKVRITGDAKEFTSTSNGNNSSLTELDISTTGTVQNLGAGVLPTVTNIQIPVTNATDLERYEGMLVNISALNGDLTVTENFQLGRFGQVVLAASSTSNQPGTDARLDQFTQFNAPSVSGNTAYLAEQATRRVYLDDGSSAQNVDPILFGRGGNPLSATNTLRSGDTVNNITGVLDERFEGYRIQTTTPVNFNPTNARPDIPPTVGGTLKVANFNILNYFNDLGSSTTTFINDAGQSLTLRGANNATEFTRQRDKIIQAIINSGADVVGLNEVQNNGFGTNSAIQNLVNGLNAIAGAGTYAFIQPPTTNPKTTISTDAITVGMIYKTGQVTPVGDSAVMPLGYSADFDLVGRRPLAQTFQQISGGQQFTAVVNHFKSKGSSSGGAGDNDAGDGQGLSNGTRTRQAQALATWLATKPTGSSDSDYIILGDLNAYAKEDPLTALATAGYDNLLPITSYSFVFNGQVGSLDHALGNNTLTAQLSGAEKWHINADEPNVLDYNTEFKTAGQVASLYNNSQFRSFDHDPVVVGLNLNSPVVIESAFTSQLVTINNKYFALDPLPNRYTNIKYAGSNVGTDSYQGWSVIGAESIGNSDARVIWKSTSGLFWYSTNTDNGGIVSNIIPFETDFQQDFNNDGVIGSPTSIIESLGTTALSVDSSGRYIANNGGAFNANILYSNTPIGPNDFPGWSVIGAEIVNDQVLAMWKSSGGIFWLTTNASNGGIVSDIGSYESIFQQDFDNNGSINPGGLISQIGTAVADTFGGASTNDLLIGGAGTDTFVLNQTNNGLDVIVDFAANEFLDISSFNLSNFSNSNIRVGSGATTATSTSQFILNTDNGALYFDADGANGNPASKLANLLGISNLTPSNFISSVSNT